MCAAGTVVGYVDSDVVRATGIRYARADRFRPPQPEPAATEPILATEPAPACPQAPVPMLDVVLARPMRGMTYDEHCQQLSLTLPADVDPDEAPPVMVWVNGGSYTSGAGDAPIYDARALVVEQRVVVVSVTYRLSLFGFLGSAAGRPANLGLLDLVEALRWTQRNIAAFGGDPDKVTLFGQSAGGDAIAHLMAASGAQGLFRRAIVQSPPLGIARGRARMSEAMAEAAAGIEESAAASEVVAAEAAVVTRAAPFRLLAAMPFGTQYGFPPLPAEDALDEAWSAAAPHVDLLIGWTRREVALFAPEHPLLSRISPVPPRRAGRPRGRGGPAHPTGAQRGGPGLRSSARPCRGPGLPLRPLLGRTSQPLRRRPHRRAPPAVRRRGHLARRHAGRGRSLVRGRAPGADPPPPLGRLRAYRPGPAREAPRPGPSRRGTDAHRPAYCSQVVKGTRYLVGVLSRLWPLRPIRPTK